MIRNIISGRCDTAVKAAEMLRHDFNIDVSAQTARNVLKVAGLQAKHKIKQPSILRRIKRSDWNFRKCISIGLLMIGIALFGLMNPKSIALDQMEDFGVGN
uniref:AlNc14C140G7215 protein n=1 Tax=Albugo laibachii Nc14 TaxID=890382 RepID=F0WL27_9STRA|nr:AlNc14C140G7215 [Albugo laibachii Nc14]CCA27562.1 AlNc14C574G12194 [Albugo laibachii Nc14]|eukprot:CCA27562.1 AlNc14C574G12194 [Albugo laibachii Nc14]